MVSRHEASARASRRLVLAAAFLALFFLGLVWLPAVRAERAQWSASFACDNREGGGRTCHSGMTAGGMQAYRADVAAFIQGNPPGLFGGVFRAEGQGSLAVCLGHAMWNGACWYAFPHQEIGSRGVPVHWSGSIGDDLGVNFFSVHLEAYARSAVWSINYTVHGRQVSIDSLSIIPPGEIRPNQSFTVSWSTSESIETRFFSGGQISCNQGGAVGASGQASCVALSPGTGEIYMEALGPLNTGTWRIVSQSRNVQIVSDPGPIPPNGGGGGPTRSVCQSGQCVQVPGEGPNECSTNAQCTPGTSCNPPRWDGWQVDACYDENGVANCNRQQEVADLWCQNICGGTHAQSFQTAWLGGGTKYVPTGRVCPHCEFVLTSVSCGGGGGPTRSICQSGQCVQVPGEGPNECSTNAQCRDQQPPTRSICQSGQCVQVPGEGPNDCSADAQCRHTVCTADGACVLLNTPGSSQCTSQNEYFDCPQPPPSCTFSASPDRLVIRPPPPPA